MAYAAAAAALGGALIGSPTVALAEAPSWIDLVNRYRVATGLTPVTEQPSWSAGIAAHLRYLALTPAELITGQYASAHTENPASPYYTPAGAQGGGSSNMGGGSDDVDTINRWLAGPFHAIGILRPGLRHVGFARDPATGTAGLDVIRGLTGGARSRDPVLFPGAGMTTDRTTYSGSESPNPLETCGYETAGLPLIALLPNDPSPKLRATLTGPTGTVSSDTSDLCVITRHHYVTSDSVYGPTGLAILAGDNAVVVISRTRLRAGQYSVRLIQEGSSDITWSFSVLPSLAKPKTKPKRRSPDRK